MGKIFFLFFVMTLVGCTSDGKGSSGGHAENVPSVDDLVSLESVDLTGTWMLITERKSIRKDNGDYVGSQFHESIMIFEDTDKGVRFSDCANYDGVFGSYAVKTETRFYFNASFDSGYTLKKDDSLVRSSTLDDVFGRPNIRQEIVETLVRVSTEIELDGGGFKLSGPVSVEEYSQLCASVYYSNIGLSRSVNLVVPLDGSSLEFQLRLNGPVSEGLYEVTDIYGKNSIVLGIYSSANSFWTAVGSNTLAPKSSEVEIIEISDQKISGSFSLVGQDDGDYSGEFEIFFRNSNHL